MIIDTHCHYNIEPLFSGKSEYLQLAPHSPLSTLSWREHWQKAQAEGVRASIVIGVDVATSQRALQIASMETHLHAAVGIHPEEFQKLAESEEVGALSVESATESFHTSAQEQIEQLMTLVALADKPLTAIGEIGLDYFRLSQDDKTLELTKIAQRIGFEAQLKLARQLNLPAILHVRDKTDAAYFEVLELLRENWKPGKPFVLHCVSGPLEYVREAVELGAYIGIAANVTYPSAQNIREIVAAVPADRLLSETDAPFLAPQGHRGEICEPWMINKTVAYLETLGVSPAQLVKNAQKAFGV